MSFLFCERTRCEIAYHWNDDPIFGLYAPREVQILILPVQTPDFWSLRGASWRFLGFTGAIHPIFGLYAPRHAQIWA